jgi:protein gp37
MSENSKIQWTDHTFNPWMGCTEVSPGCVNCYAAVSTPVRAMGIEWGKGQPRKRTSEANWNEPLRWNRQAENRSGPLVMGAVNYAPNGEHDTQVSTVEIKRRPRVFCASLADWLDDEVLIGWLADLLKLIHDTPNLDWLLLTKRPQNFHKQLLLAMRWIVAESPSPPEEWRWEISQWLSKWHEGYQVPSNVWVGTTVENQVYADKRIVELAKIPAKRRFLSCEPLLMPLDLSSARLSKLFAGEVELIDLVDWVIIGGESGPKARPCNVEWMRSLVQQCKEAGVAPFVKQFGAKPMAVDGARLLLEDKKGGKMSEWPEDLRVREFPV